MISRTLGKRYRNGLYFLLVINLIFFISCRSESPSPDSSHLIITEVGATSPNDFVAWFEIYNKGLDAVDLSNFQFRSRSIGTSAGDWSGNILTFDLPGMIIYPGSFVIVQGKTANDLNNGGQISYVKHSNGSTPYWDSRYGFIELLSNGETVDFVRFGELENALPQTSAHWTGGTAPTLPSASDSDLGKSLARSSDVVDNHSPDDWTLWDFSTPGGPNDVTSNEDLDQDGIPDCSEVHGSTFASLPLYEWGARTGVRDIFVHIDYMDSSDPGVIPNETALNRVKEAFAAKGIALHFDVGNLFDTVAGNNVIRFDLDDKSHRVPFATGVSLGYSNDGRVNLYDYKVRYMPMARKQVFHYLLFGNTQRNDGTAGVSGVAELKGNDFLVSLGQWGLVSGSNRLINIQSSTIMHELGHNLGLKHGGGEEVNYKPNYLSIMNYLYQINGLPSIGNNEDDRYLFQHFDVGSESSLINPPTGDPSGFLLDYSDGSSSALNESSLNESNGLGRSGSSGADFNNNGVKTDNLVNFDVNFEGGNTQILSDFDDWTNINFFFQRDPAGNENGTFLSRSIIWTDVVGNDRQMVYPEDESFYKKYIKMRQE